MHCSDERKFLFNWDFIYCYLCLIYIWWTTCIMFPWFCFSFIRQLTTIIFLADFHGKHIFQTKIQDAEFHKIFLCQVFHWEAHLDWDCEVVADRMLESFLVYGVTGLFNWGSVRVFSAGLWCRQNRRALCTVFNMLTLASFFSLLKRAYLKKKWVEVVTFMA